MEDDSGNENDKRKKDRGRMEMIERVRKIKIEKERKSNKGKKVF